MTNERSEFRADDISDAAVSKAYREIATELTPASLNESVLRQSVRSAGHGYARSVVWLRPMAWAATIGLCLAIVLELADVPQPGFEDFGARPAEPVAIPDADSVTTAPQPRVEDIERRERVLRDDAATNQPEAARDASAFQISDAPILEEAAAAARMRDGPKQEVLPRKARALVRGSIDSPSCDADARVSPENWLGCIDELRKAGRDLEADEQEQQLAAAFPEFELP